VSFFIWQKELLSSDSNINSMKWLARCYD